MNSKFLNIQTENNTIKSNNLVITIKKFIPFFKYFIFLFLPFYLSIIFPVFLNQNFPNDQTEYIIILLCILISLAVIIDTLISICIRYSNNLLRLIISIVISNIMLNYLQIGITYQNMGLFSGFIIAYLCSKIIIRFEIISNQTVDIKQQLYKEHSINDKKLLVCKSGIFKVHLSAFSVITINKIPVESILPLGTTLTQFGAIITESFNGVNILYSQSISGFFFKKNNLIQDLFYHYNTFVENISNLFGSTIKLNY